MGIIRALIIVSTTSQVPHVKALSARLRKAVDFTVCAVLSVDEIADHCRSAGLPFVPFAFSRFDLGLRGAIFHHVTTFIDRVLNKVERETGIKLVRLRESIEIYRERMRQISVAIYARKILADHKTDAIILFEDNAGDDTGIWVKCANRMRIKSVIVPFTIPNPLEPAEAYFNAPAHWANEGRLNRVAARKYPQWVYSHRGRQLLRLPGHRAIAAEQQGNAQPKPWLLNSSRANYIAVECKALCERYESLGFPANQLRTTGSFVDDLLFEAGQNAAALRDELGLNARDPILLCSFPPDQLNTERTDCEFTRFDDLVEFWISQLLKLEGWQIVIRPHPNMRKEDVRKLSAFPVIVSELNTASLIPLCTVYNACVSSTIRWALACGKPVLNFDVFRYGYEDFSAEPAVKTVSSKREFADCLSALRDDPQMLPALAKQATDAAPRWGMIDGQSGARILALLGPEATRTS